MSFELPPELMRGFQTVIDQMLQNDYTEMGEDLQYEKTMKEKVESFVRDVRPNSSELSRRAVEAKEKGTAFHRQGDLQRAGVCYLASKHLDPVQAAAPNNCAEVMLKLHRYRFAEVQATAALRLEPGNVKALFRRARARKMQGKFDLAGEDLDRVLLRTPDDPVILQERAEVLQLSEMSDPELESWKRRVPEARPFPGDDHVETTSELGLVGAGDHAAGEPWRGMYS